MEWGNEARDAGKRNGQKIRPAIGIMASEDANGCGFQVAFKPTAKPRLAHRKKIIRGQNRAAIPSRFRAIRDLTS